MCKIHGYHYACGHFIRYRLSRCRGTYTKVHRGSRPAANDDSSPSSSRVIVACAGECYLIIASRSLCGSCLFGEFQRRWDARIGEAETAYCRALDRGNKAGIGVWGWGGSGGVDDEDEEDEDDDEVDLGETDVGEWDAGGGVEDKTLGRRRGRKRRRDSLEDEKQATREDINHCSRVLEELRAAFSAESWDARKRFPTEWRNVYSRPRISKRVPHGSSPLRREVLPEDVVLRGRDEGVGEERGGQRYKTFQAFFVDTYSGVTEMPAVDYSAELGGKGWMGEDGSATTHTEDVTTTTGCWDAGILANINMENSLKEEENDPSGEESYYTEYERFDVSSPEQDDQEVDDPAVEEGTRESGDLLPKAQKPVGSLIAYGPKAGLSSLSEKLPLENQHVLAPGPEAAPS